MIGHKTKKKPVVTSSRSYILPGMYLVLSLVLMILPLEGIVTSFKTVLSYIFLPQIRAAHRVLTYTEGVSETVRELLDAHAENYHLKQIIEKNQLLVSQAEEVFKENQRLTHLMNLPSQNHWKGVWARVAYREPTQWNTVTLDKGSREGIVPRSAVISVNEQTSVLAGIVVEVTETTSKVLLVRDEDFSAAVYLEPGKEEGLLTGNGPHPVTVRYIPLQANVQEGEKVYTSSTSSVFPPGILIGTVSKVEPETNFQTSLTVQVEPTIHPSAVKEVFVLAKEEV